jgi:hypothetical protein
MSTGRAFGTAVPRPIRMIAAIAFLLEGDGAICVTSRG